jgi:hypothetical protein
MSTESRELDVLLSALRVFLLAIGLPLLVFGTIWVTIDICLKYYELWRMTSGLFVLALPYLPFAVIALCSAGYVVAKVASEVWNRVKR